MNDALREAMSNKCRALCVFSTQQHTPSKCNLKTLIKDDFVFQEEIIWALNTCAGRAGVKVAAERKAHVGAVLAEER